MTELTATNERLTTDIADTATKLNQLRALARKYRDQDAEKEKKIIELNVSIYI